MHNSRALALRLDGLLPQFLPRPDAPHAVLAVESGAGELVAVDSGDFGNPAVGVKQLTLPAHPRRAAPGSLLLAHPPPIGFGHAAL